MEKYGIEIRYPQGWFKIDKHVPLEQQFSFTPPTIQDVVLSLDVSDSVFCPIAKVGGAESPEQSAVALYTFQNDIMKGVDQGQSKKDGLVYKAFTYRIRDEDGVRGIRIWRTK